MSKQTGKNQIIARIKTALLNSVDNNEISFSDSMKKLLGVLGYESQRIPSFPQTGKVMDFIEMFPPTTFGNERNKERRTKSEKMFCNNIEFIKILFQVADEEIETKYKSDNFDFDSGLNKSFLFIIAELKKCSYPRGKYAQFTREINKRFNMPVVVLFRTSNSNLLTLAFVDRRENKLNPEFNVLGKVSLLKEIDLKDSHRAHLDILKELSLFKCISWINSNKKHRPNFDGLLAAWLDKLDIEKLNQKFYEELFKWFERAVEKSCFPRNKGREQSDQEHVIRLITRLLFVWFVKEKGLVEENLFNEEKIKELMVNYDPDSHSSYYRIVLQNLFFGTLNAEIHSRGFSEVENIGWRDCFGYRYGGEIRNQEELLAWFEQTPFINGGLFDCLDDEDRKIPSIPNMLFFDEDGLFPLLCRYKFTVEENTQAEQEVALDPELLGRVFENLLGTFNPETKEVARKASGSYYTPREIVSYMVDEGLKAYLSQVISPIDEDRESNHNRLNILFDSVSSTSELEWINGRCPFSDEEISKLVNAIGQIKILDPAVGSGAFPMGILQRLVQILNLIDPENKYWKQQQVDTISQMDEPETAQALQDIKEIFSKENDFGRKLYLIQNAIHGVDIQPIACQITKLRFFISLMVEQEPNNNADDNYGIRPLPNLETRFIAADSLLGLNKPFQRRFRNRKIDAKEQELRGIRQKHFKAKTSETKDKCRARDKKLRLQITRLLEKDGWNDTNAQKIADWDPYDQNAPAADWFDSEYMFGVIDGFDLVIGNPPYIQLQKNSGKLGQIYKNTGFDVFESTGDIYCLFYEKGVNLLKQNGHLCYITSNKWMQVKYGESLRKFLVEKTNPLNLLDLGGHQIFHSVSVDTSILVTQNTTPMVRELKATRFKNDFAEGDSISRYVEHNAVSVYVTHDTWLINNSAEIALKEKIERKGIPLKDWDISIYRGVVTGCNDAFIIDNETKKELVSSDPNSIKILKPIIRGRDIKRYRTNLRGRWLIDSHNGYENVPPVIIENYPAIKQYLSKFFPKLEERQDQGITPYNLRSCAYHEEHTIQPTLD